jgi:hypothetical protein
VTTPTEFTMIGLGLQEIIVLAVCCGLPLIGGAVALVLILSQKKKAARPRSDNWDEPNDDR